MKQTEEVRSILEEIDSRLEAKIALSRISNTELLKNGIDTLKSLRKWIADLKP